MKKQSILLLVALLLCLPMFCGSIACADDYTLHTPKRGQLQENEALDIACDFLRDLTGVEITGIFQVVDGMKIEGQVFASFGPGNQWRADTTDDCWALVIRNESTIGRPLVVLHGTTGEVLYWEYTDKITNCTYFNSLPGEEHLSYENAVEIAKNGLMHVINEPLSGMLSVSAGFGNTDAWNTATANMGTELAWVIDLYYLNSEGQYGYSVYINAENGEVLREQLLGDGATVLYESYQP